MKDVNYFLSCAIDSKHKIDNLYSSGVVGFVIKTKLFQAECFANRFAKAFFSKNQTQLEKLEKEYKNREQFSKLKGVVKPKYVLGETNPVALFNKASSASFLYDYKNVRRLAFLCFYHQYSYKWDEEIFSECCNFKEEDLLKNQKKALDYVHKFFMFPEIALVQKKINIPKHPMANKVLKIYENNFTILGDNSYKNHFSDVLNDYMQDYLKQKVYTKQKMGLIDIINNTREKSY